MQRHRIPRRTLLESCSVAALGVLAGCMDGDDSGDGGSNGNDAPGSGSGSASDGAFEETMPAGSLGEDGWRHPRYSARMTGYNPSANPPDSVPSQAWSQPIAVEPLVADGQVQFCSSGRLDAQSGDQAGGAPSNCRGSLLAIGDGLVYEAEDVGSTSDPEMEVRAVEADSGEVRWRWSDQAVGSTAVTGDAVVVSSSRTTLEGSVEPIHVLEANSGDLRWERETDPSERVTDVLAATEDKVFAALQVGDPQEIGADETRVRAYDLETGEPLWDEPSMPPLAGTVAGGRLFTLEVRGDDQVVRALDATSGTEQWRQNPTEGVDGIARLALSPTLTNDHLLVSIGGGAAGSAHRLRAFTRNGGDLDWERRFEHDDLDAGRQTAPAAASGRTAICGTGSGTLLALDVESGDELWRHAATESSITAVVLAGAAVIASTGTETMRFE